jgi:predicted TIM-barrel fold metal-dependent hydrolase
MSPASSFAELSQNIMSYFSSPLPHPIIDMHVHLWQHSLQNDARVLMRMIERYNLAWIGVMPLWGAHYPTPEAIRAGNDSAIKFCEAKPKTCKFFVTVNPRHGQFAADEIRRGVEKHNAVCAKVWVGARADETCLDVVAQACIEHDLPLLLHAFHKKFGQLAHETDAQHVAILAKRFPELKIVMAHLAGNHVWGCAQIADCPNVWSDFSGSYCETGSVENAVKTLGLERVLFGSDAPGIDFFNNVAKVEEADLTSEQRRRIYHDNAAALFSRAALTN